MSGGTARCSHLVDVVVALGGRLNAGAAVGKAVDERPQLAGVDHSDTLRHTHTHTHTRTHARTHTRHTPDRLLYVDHRDDADSPALTTRSVSRSVLLPTTTSGTYWARPPPPPRP